MQVPAISAGLIDQHSYVRRTAVMGVLKVYNIDKHAVHNTGGAWWRTKAFAAAHTSTERARQRANHLLLVT